MSNGEVKGETNQNIRRMERKNRLNEGFHSRLIDPVYPFCRSDDPERSRKIKSSQRELVVECTTTTPVSLCAPDRNQTVFTGEGGGLPQ